MAKATTLSHISDTLILENCVSPPDDFAEQHRMGSLRTSGRVLREGKLKDALSSWIQEQETCFTLIGKPGYTHGTSRSD